MGAIGLEPQAESSQPLTGCEPWDLICSVIVNQPLRPKLNYLLGILQPSNQVPIMVRKLIQTSNNRQGNEQDRSSKNQLLGNKKSDPEKWASLFLIITKPNM